MITDRWILKNENFKMKKNWNGRHRNLDTPFTYQIGASYKVKHFPSQYTAKLGKLLYSYVY